MPQLTVLNLAHNADDDVLRALVKHCQQLRSLDISGGSRVTGSGVRLLSNARQLRTVDLGSPAPAQVVVEDVTLLLQENPGLQSLGTYPHAGRALVEVVGPTDLRHLHDIDTDSTIMAAVVARCPKLSSLHLDRPADCAVAQLRQLAALLELKITRFNCASLENLLLHREVKWHSLELLLGRGTWYLDALSRCPQLEELVCFKMERLSHRAVPTLAAVEQIEVTHCPVGVTSLIYLLGACPRLRNATLDVRAQLADADLLQVCTDGPPMELHSLFLRNAPQLTALTVEVLMQACPELRVLGELETWSVLEEELQEVMQFIQDTNTDLTLVLSHAE